MYVCRGSAPQRCSANFCTHFPYKYDMKIFLILLLLVSCCAVSVPAQSKGDVRSQIVAELDSTAAGWNSGDLPKYLAAYVPEATEMTPEGPKGGVEEIEKTMRAGFWKNGRPAQILRYENIVVRPLGKKNALVTGQYVLSGGGRADRKGWFT